MARKSTQEVYHHYTTLFSTEPRPTMTTISDMTSTAVIHAPFSSEYSVISLEEGAFQGSKILFKPSRPYDPTDPRYTGSVVFELVEGENRPLLSDADFFPPSVREAFWNPGGVFGSPQPRTMRLSGLEVVSTRERAGPDISPSQTPGSRYTVEVDVNLEMVKLDCTRTMYSALSGFLL